MGTYNHNSKSTSTLLWGLRGLLSTVFIRVISTPEPPSSLREEGLGFRV